MKSSPCAGSGDSKAGACNVLLFNRNIHTAAHKNSALFTGLGIMIGSLVLRIGIEFLAMIKKTHLPADGDLRTHTKQLIKFYKKRKIIHFVVTPLLFLTYICGFLLLLPLFKQEFSAGFYTYIVVSSIVVFIGLAVLIGYQVRQELRVLKELMGAFKP